MSMNMFADDPIKDLLSIMAGPPGPARDAATKQYNEMMVSGGAHALPAMTTTAPRTPHGASGIWGDGVDGAHALPAMVSRAAAPPQAHQLPTMVSQNPGPVAPDQRMLVGNPQESARELPVEQTGSTPPPADFNIAAMLQPGAPLGGQFASQPPQGSVAPTPDAAPPAPPSNPLITPTPADAPHKNFLQRIGDHMSHMLTGDAPKGYEQMGLTPEEVESARPDWRTGISHEPGAMGPAEQWRANLDSIIAHKRDAGAYNTAQGQQALAIGTQRQLLADRAQFMKDNPFPKTGTRDDVETWMLKRAAHAVSTNDTEALKSITPFLDKLIAPPKQFEGKPYIGPTGQIQMMSQEPGTIIPPGYKLLAPEDAKDQDLFRLPKPDATGSTMAYLKKGSPVPPGWVKQSEAAQMTIQGLIGDRFDRGQVTKGMNDFNSTIKDLRGRASMIDQALMTIGSAANDPNPANRKVLYKSAVANFVQAADQKATLRYQMLQYFNQLDPSIGGKWETLKDQLLKGERPAYQMKGMLAHMENVKKLVRSEIDAQRSDWESRRPELEGLLPATDSFFPSTGLAVPAAVAQPSGGAADAAAAKANAAADAYWNSKHPKKP